MLDIKTRNRIDWFCKNKINDFAPTIAPAPKNLANCEIESIEEAVSYYLQRGVDELVVQKKYMGSYCSIYLKKRIEETYFVSRNGYRMDHIDVKAALESISDLHQKMLNKYPDFDTIIIASELLPWRVLGIGLIENEFYGYYDAHKKQKEYLKDNKLYEKIQKVKNSESFVRYVEDKLQLNSKQLHSKYKPHIIRQYDALQKFKVLDLETQENALTTFKTQIDTFGKEEKIHCKPFTILKIVQEDGSEVIPNSNLTYNEINEDTFLHLKITAENKADEIKKISAFFEKLHHANEEGIMIKPCKSYIKGMPPCFKIRNNNYLTMIYGINFQSDFEHYITKRNIQQKLEQSIQSWEINQQMLQLPYKNLNEDNYLLKLLVLKRINGESIEKALDPRL